MKESRRGCPRRIGALSVCLLIIEMRGHFIHHPFSVDCATSRKISAVYFVLEAGTAPFRIERG
jgi:hypothetical protein